MATLAVEKQRALAAGDKKTTGFKGAVRSLENTGLEKGDEFTFPTGDYEVYSTKIGDREIDYIFVELPNGNAKRFFPSTFTKARTVYNEDGNSTGTRMFTTGTAAEEFRKYGKIEDGMNALKGKTVVVTDIKPCRTLRYGTTELMDAQIPQIDFKP